TSYLSAPFLCLSLHFFLLVEPTAALHVYTLSLHDALPIYILKWLEVEKYSFYSFRNRYCEMGGYGGYEVVGYKNLKELQGKLDSVMLRRKKDEVLDLPDKIRSVDYVEMSAKQRQIY